MRACGFVVVSPFHGGNTGSSPVGRANDFNDLASQPSSVSNGWPINGPRDGRTAVLLALILGDIVVLLVAWIWLRPELRKLKQLWLEG